MFEFAEKADRTIETFYDRRGIFSMETQPTHNISGKTVLIFRLILIFVVSAGIAEMAEVVAEPYFSSNKLIFELVEHTILIGLLLVFMTRYVTSPMLREMALRKQSEQLLEKSEYKNRSIIEALPDAVLQVSADGTVLDYKPKQNSKLKLTAGQNVSDALPPETLLNFLNCMNSTLQNGQTQHIDLLFKHDTETCYLVFNFVKSAENEVTVFIRDITRRKMYEEQLEHLSTHDVLTGLYNRTFYEAELDRLAAGRRYPISIIIIDLDGLKNTNDSYGHAAGDTMICKAASILKHAFRADDLVARTGGDEFTILLPETGVEALQSAVERIEHNLNETYKIEDGFHVKFSLGTAIAATKENLFEAVKTADMKMYQNKATRKSAQENI